MRKGPKEEVYVGLGLGCTSHPAVLRLNSSSWKRTAELMLKRWRDGRLHARSWKYDPNPLLVSSFPPPLPKPLLGCVEVSQFLQLC